MASLSFSRTGRTGQSKKYRNIKTVLDGIAFSSKREAARYMELKLLERVGDIFELECQPRFTIKINGKLVCHYTADFRYKRGDAIVVEDVKSRPTMTTSYRLKKRLMDAVHGIVINEVG